MEIEDLAELLIVLVATVWGIVSSRRKGASSPAGAEPAAVAAEDGLAARVAFELRQRQRLQDLGPITQRALARLDEIQRDLQHETAEGRMLSSYLQETLKPRLERLDDQVQRVLKAPFKIDAQSGEVALPIVHLMTQIQESQRLLDVAQQVVSEQHNLERHHFLSDASAVVAYWQAHWPGFKKHAPRPIVLMGLPEQALHPIFRDQVVVVAPRDLSTRPTAWVDLATGFARWILRMRPELAQAVRELAGRGEAQGHLPEIVHGEVRFEIEWGWAAWAEGLWVDLMAVRMLGPAAARAMLSHWASPNKPQNILIGEAARDGLSLSDRPPPLVRAAYLFEALRVCGYHNIADRLEDRWRRDHIEAYNTGVVILPARSGERVAVSARPFLDEDRGLVERFSSTALPTLPAGFTQAFRLSARDWPMLQVKPDNPLLAQLPRNTIPWRVAAMIEGHALTRRNGKLWVDWLCETLRLSNARDLQRAQAAPEQSTAQWVRDAVILRELLYRQSPRQRLPRR